MSKPNATAVFLFQVWVTQNFQIHTYPTNKWLICSNLRNCVPFHLLASQSFTVTF